MAKGESNLEQQSVSLASCVGIDFQYIHADIQAHAYIPTCIYMGKDTSLGPAGNLLALHLEPVL